MRPVSKLLILALVASTFAFSGVARSQEEAPKVTLEAESATIDFGDIVRLKGVITPVAEGQSISIFDTADGLLDQVLTDAQGRFTAELLTDSNLDLYAQWGEAISEIQQVKVVPLISARLGRVRLFGKSVVSGTVTAPPTGGRVMVSVFRNGRFLWKREANLSGTDYRFSFTVQRPGSFRARAAYANPDLEPAKVETDAKATRLPNLGEGSQGPFVKLLERRLRHIGYHLTGVNSTFDYRTADAMRAFNKVQGSPRVGTVSEATWRALAAPEIPKPRARSPKFHIEVDQTKQVLYVVEGGKVRKIIHVSTGAGYATRDGVFHVHRKLAGHSGNRLYYPSYFDGLRAIHGWTSVPTYNASHGCVRVPYWTAQWIYGLADIGTEIRIYH
ncbi:MAG TPA: L,D-transpeptidase family protein [Actinomycetota bacterium]|nr:L,D-transpeptidase family protein [Actinomycetota bacterium]